MTDHARAIEAGARAIFNASTYQGYTREFLESEWARCKSIEMAKAKACIEAAIASGALVPASAGKPFDKIKAGLEEAVSIAKGEQPAARIYVQGHEYTPASATKPYSSAEFLTSPEALDEYVKEMVASAVAAERERCASLCAQRSNDCLALSELLREKGAADYAWGDENIRCREASYLCACIRALSPAPASGEFVVVPRADLQVVVDIAGRNESAIEIECIKEWLKDAATKDGSGA